MCERENELDPRHEAIQKGLDAIREVLKDFEPHYCIDITIHRMGWYDDGNLLGEGILDTISYRDHMEPLVKTCQSSAKNME